MKFEISKFLKTPQALEQIDSITLADLLEESGATGFKPMNATGKVSSRVHIMKGEQRLFAIALGKGVKLVNDVTTKEGLQELLKNHIIYYGVSSKEAGFTGNPWIAFGKKGELVQGRTYSVEELAETIGDLATV